MKRLLACFLILGLLLVPAAAESAFDNESLLLEEGLYSFTHPGTANTVVRPENQPYFGQVDEGYDGDLLVYVDYVILPDLDATLIRLFLSTTTFDALTAQEIRLTVGDKQWTFTVDYDQSEYDGIYMEDYIICLTDASLTFLKAVAQQKKDDPIPVEFLVDGEVALSGLVIIPGQDAADLYDLFIDLGGKMQPLKDYDELWPCKVEKTK